MSYTTHFFTFIFNWLKLFSNFSCNVVFASQVAECDVHVPHAWQTFGGPFPVPFHFAQRASLCSHWLGSGRAPRQASRGAGCSHGCWCRREIMRRVAECQPLKVRICYSRAGSVPSRLHLFSSSSGSLFLPCAAHNFILIFLNDPSRCTGTKFLTYRT